MILFEVESNEPCYPQTSYIFEDSARKVKWILFSIWTFLLDAQKEQEQKKGKFFIKNCDSQQEAVNPSVNLVTRVPRRYKKSLNQQLCHFNKMIFFHSSKVEQIPII